MKGLQTNNARVKMSRSPYKVYQHEVLESLRKENAGCSNPRSRRAVSVLRQQHVQNNVDES